MINSGGTGGTMIVTIGGLTDADVVCAGLPTILNTAVSDEILTASPCRVRGAGVTKRARRIEPATRREL